MFCSVEQFIIIIGSLKLWYNSPLEHSEHITYLGINLKLLRLLFSLVFILLVKYILFFLYFLKIIFSISFTSVFFRSICSLLALAFFAVFIWVIDSSVLTAWAVEASSQFVVPVCLGRHWASVPSSVKWQYNHACIVVWHMN